MSNYKIGLHEQRNFSVILKYFRDRLGYDSSKNNNTNSNSLKINGARPCFYSYGQNKQFGYRTGQNGVHY